MKDDRQNFFTRNAVLRLRILVAAAPVAAVLLSIMFFAARASSIEIPPAVEKKTVLLKQSYQDAGRIFTAKCGQCHKVPDPAAPGQAKTDCTKTFSKEDLVTVQNYMADVRTGKDLYESRCGRCHTLIDPGAHTADYWSKNLCTSDECFVKKLHGDEEQQLLMYLSSHSKKN